MHPYILAPPHCTSGATYMFWVKQLVTLGGLVLTTMDEHPPQEGIRLYLYSDGSFFTEIYKLGPNKNKFSWKANYGFMDNILQWKHIIVVWKTDPELAIYLNGKPKGKSPDKGYSGNSEVHEAPMRMFVGRSYVTHSHILTNKMIFDELRLFARPLDEADLLVYLNWTAWNTTCWFYHLCGNFFQLVTANTFLEQQVILCNKFWWFSCLWCLCFQFKEGKWEKARVKFLWLHAANICKVVRKNTESHQIKEFITTPAKCNFVE